MTDKTNQEGRTMMMNTETNNEHPKRQGWRFLLIATAVASIAANGVYGITQADPTVGLQTLAGFIHAFAPLLLVVLVELVIGTLKFGIRPLAYVVLVVCILTAATAAFILSFASLLDLSRQYGHMSDDRLNFLFPLLFDLVMGGATFMVLDLSERPVRRTRKKKPAKEPRTHRGLIPLTRELMLGTTVQESVNSTEEVREPRVKDREPNKQDRELPVRESTDSPAVTSADSSKVREPILEVRELESVESANLPAGDVRDRAHELVDSGKTTSEVHEVESVLKFADDGLGPKSIVERTGVPRGRVMRIIAADKDRRTPQTPTLHAVH